ncbi:MAG TPA: DUF2282 domain-containing protein, partial [Rhodanobacteraceae bacterium]
AALGMTWLGGGIAVAGTASAATIKQDPKPPVMTAAIIRNRTKIYTQGWVKCYGINAADKNTCHTATVNCGTNAPEHDPDAFVAVPKGLCTRIAGGSLTPKIAVQAAKADGMPLPRTPSGDTH